VLLQCKIMTFWEDHILTLRGCCTSNFYTLENDLVLLVNTPLGTGIPLTTFCKGGLRFSKCMLWG